ncbi:glycyl-radical enzyme activating protein [Candidatus Merdisoma sp. JLR.KK006]|uniref:glycyl-radical enzyme activating protein n=1 Tax=Candidatus Merdisoma sp. JLR.KK006 TaxID=3112626 RepID=UPI002FEEF2DB
MPTIDNTLKGLIFNIQKFSINDGPGIRSTVFFAGCPLSCRWCSNPESQNRNREAALASGDPKLAGKEWTVDQVIAEVEKDRCFYEESGGGITLSGGEVLQQHAFANALLKEAHKHSLHCAAETTGFASHEVFSEFIQNIDLLLFDMKHWDREMHHEKTGVYNDIILENMRYALEQKIPVIARIPVIPGFNANKKAATGMAALLKDMGITEVHLLPFHQFGEKKYEQLGIPYEMSGMNQLHPENLQAYLDIFLKDGLEASFR